MSPRTASLIAALLAILHAALAVTALLDKSPTYDEPAHLTAGYSYWLRDDYRLDSENGILPARWAALPLLFSHPKFVDAKAPGWQRVSVGLTSRQFFQQEGNVPYDLLLQARIAMSVFGAALCFLIFSIADRFFGPLAALLCEAFAVLDPNLLANSPLVASDVAAALFFIGASWAVWRLLEKVSLRSLTIAAVSLAGLFLSKMSAPIIVPIAALLALVRLMLRTPIPVSIVGCRRTFADAASRCAVMLAAFVVLAATTILALWGAYGFRFSALTETGESREVLNWRWDYLLSESTPTSHAIGFARKHHLLPEAYLYGLLYTAQTSSSRPAFLDGQCSDTGFPAFFLRALLYKTPLPLLCLVGITIASAIIRWIRRRPADQTPSAAWSDATRLTPLCALAVIYGCFAFAGHLNIGFRHLLPVYTVLLIVSGATIQLWRGQRRRLGMCLAVILVLGQTVESFAVRPHYLAYFNQIAGGPSAGYRHLVDSSLDWGQDLPSLGDWLQRNTTAFDNIYLGYFGSIDPTLYGIRARGLPEPSRFHSLGPGFYCISATTLQQVYEPWGGCWRSSYEFAYRKAMAWHNGFRATAFHEHDTSEMEQRRDEVFSQLQFARLCAYLRHQEPLAEIGYSILVYRLDQPALTQALLGPQPE